MNIFTRSYGIIWIIALLLVIMAGCSGGNSSKMSEEDKAPDFELDNLDGQKMSLADTEGKARLVYFYFSSCPDVCLPTTQLLSKVQEQLKQKDVFAAKTAILSITFDPARDTPERLKEFSGFYNADPAGWFFLRGEEQYSRDLALAYKVNVVDLGEGQFAHGNIILLVDPSGYIPKYYNANDIELDAEDIVKDMLALLK